MNRFLPVFLFLFFSVTVLSAQTTLPNMDLESWTDHGNYEEPSGGVWTTANKIVDLLPLVLSPTTNKTTDAQSGTYAAKIETKTAFGSLAAGVLATGTFDATATPPDNLQMGMPFTGRPSTFTGYFKYTSVSGDSCDIYAILSKWNGSGRDVVGEARYPRIDYSVTTYTAFDTPFTYYSADIPDTISLVFSSSAGGATFAGQVGSTLLVDNIGFDYATGIDDAVSTELAVKVYPNPSSGIVNLSFSKVMTNANVEVFDLQGRMVLTNSINGKHIQLEVSSLPSGIYHYQVKEGTSGLASGNFLKQ